MALNFGLRRTAVSLLAQGAHTMPSLKPCTEGELDGCADEIDLAPKPLRPGTNGMKGLPLHECYEDKGSLPSTPDPREIGPDELESDTRQLLLVFYQTHTGMCPPEKSHNRALPTMRRVVADILEKHQLVYKGMLQRLQLDSEPKSMDFISQIAKTMFKDGKTNWGRITSLVAFGAVVCTRLVEARREECVEAVANQISNYLISEQHHWLLCNNGWDGFVEFFREQDVESMVRNTLMAVVGCAGIGAGLAFLMR
ncbi:induced myeloid leukemia cell differentiation protein Mcl-1a [Pseudorasbora parva]|uniref:induced myeloid leukemia cell differentiation protein Mcl-1a n=1 Tax=Pseudorasbora parva TaxID=51549 RepID=UPI00351EED71